MLECTIHSLKMQHVFFEVCMKDFLNCQISQDLCLLLHGPKGDVPVANICSICCYIFLFTDSIRYIESKMKCRQRFSSPGREVQPKKAPDIDWKKCFIYMPGRFCRNSLLFIELEKWQCTRKLRQSCRVNPKVQMLQRIASADESGESRRWCCIGSHSSSMVLSTTKNAMRCFQMPSWSAWRRATSKIRSGQANQMDQQQDRQVNKF